MAATSKVGTAYAEYRFDLKGFRQDKAEILKGLREIQQGGKLPPIKFPAPNTAPIKAAGDAAAKAAQQALTLAQAEASLLKAQGDLPGAFNRLSQALVGVDRSSIGAIRAQTQLAGIANKMKADTGGLSSVLGGVGPQLLSMAGAFGVVTSAATAAVIAFEKTKEGFNLVASIDASKRSLGAFLGDQARANQAFSDGAAFAEKYKIKQSEIANALSSLAPLLRTSTTETEKQLEVLSRLQSLNPRETFEGAAFAAKELASGDYVSLVERFNLGRDAAQRLRDEVAGGADVFQVLDAELNRMGATVDVLNTRTQGAAGAQAAYAKASEDLLLALGTLVQGPGTAFLNFLAESAASSAKFIQDISGATSANLSGGILQAGQSYEAYAQSVNVANAAQRELIAQTDPLGALLGTYPQVQQLSQAQYAYAQSLIATGQNAQTAFAATQQHSDALFEVNALMNQATIEGGAYGAQLGTLAAQAIGVASANAEAVPQVQTVVAAFLDGDISAAQLAASLGALEQSQALQAAASAESAAATQAEAEAKAEATAISDDYYAAVTLETEGLYENLQSKLEGEIQSQRLADAEATLASLGSQVASGMLTAAQGAAQLAAQYRITSGEAMRLIQLQATLARQEKVKAAGFAGVPEAYLGAAIGGRAGGSTQGPSDTVLTQIAEEGEEAAKRYEAAVADYEAAERQAKREEEERRRQLERLADLQRDHEEKILSIKEDYAKKQLEAEKKNNLSKLQSRAAFYDALTQAEASGDISSAQAQALAASYEQAFAESQKLAQEGKAALAADYLELRQQQIQEELAYEQAVAAARESGNEAEVRRLQQIEELKRAAREEELKQLLEGGDANQNARDDALKAENERYIEQQAEILGVTEEVAAARVKGEEVAAAATAAGNLELEKRLRLMRDIGDASVGRETAAQQAAAPVATPAPTPTPTTPAPQAPTAPTLPAGEGGTAILVQDPAVAALLIQIATVLETQGAVAGRGAAASEQAAAASREQVAETRRLADKVGRLGTGKGLAS